MWFPSALLRIRVHFSDNDGAYELALEITVGEAEIMGFNLFNDKGEKVDIYFNLPEKRLVMDRTKSGIVDFGKKSVSRDSRFQLPADDRGSRGRDRRSWRVLQQDGGRYGFRNKVRKVLYHPFPRSCRVCYR